MTIEDKPKLRHILNLENEEEAGTLIYESPATKLLKFHTARLFVEKTEKHLRDPEITRYTLASLDKEVDGVVYKSLRRLYLEEEDIAEYTFAEKYLSCWEHWDYLCSLKWFQEHLYSWRKELLIRVKAKALKSITDEAMLEGKNAFAANKWLLANKWDYVENSLAPSSQKNTYVSKKAIKEEAKKISKDANDTTKVSSDFDLLSDVLKDSVSDQSTRDPKQERPN